MARLIEVLRAHCTIVPGTTLAAIKTEHRDASVNVFGRAGSESIQIARERRSVLWTDDHVLARYAGGADYECARSWTNGRELVQMLARNSDAVFGLNVLAAEGLKQIATDWLERKGNNRIIIP